MTMSAVQERTHNSHCFENKSLLNHLEDLRRMLLVIGGTIVTFFLLIMFIWPDGPLMLATSPLKEKGIELIYLGLGDVLYVQLKINLLLAIVLSVPIIVWQVWNFAKPGLYPKEQHRLLGWSVLAVLLFGMGAVFGYYSVFLMALSFFVYTGQSFALPILSIEQYSSFLLSFVLASGVVFELPLCCYIMAELGLITAHTLKAMRKFFILGAFIVAAFVTPTDVMSQILMAIPMLLLYEISIFLIGK